MPQKTKHKKIIASYRNKLKQINPQLITQKSFSIVQSIANEPLSSNKESNNLTQYFKTDFTKSLLLISGIITLELIFYFVSINNNLRSILKFIP